MKVILKKAVAKVGLKDEVKEVSDGFARNFLIPNGEAKLATQANLKELAKRMALKEKAPKKDNKGKKVRKKKVKKVKKTKK